MAITFITYEEMARDVMRLVPWCEKNRPSAIYGCPRSGVVAAGMLSLALNLPLGMPGYPPQAGMCVSARPRDWNGPPLLLEDSVNNGHGIKTASAAMTIPEFRTGAVYVRPEVKNLVNIYSRIVPGPRFFQWNVMNHDAGRYFMFDLDGVLCRDSTVFDDDGPEYQAGLSNAAPLHLSAWPLGWVVTNRIERWRGITEDWLKRHNFEVVHKVVMQPYQTAVERRAKSTPAGFKARTYAASNAWLYIESHDAIAQEIHNRCGRPVLSVQSWKLYQK